MLRPYRLHDRLIVGAGVFGLYAAHLLTSRGMDVSVVDVDDRQVMRASLVNQARVHNGYHYPRSAFTALQSSAYYSRFVRDFAPAINGRFTAVYAVSATGSYTDALHFEKFCKVVGIRARKVDALELFRPGAVEAAFETDELSFDAPSLRRLLLERIERAPGRCSWYLGQSVKEAGTDGPMYSARLSGGTELRVGGVINASYAGTNGVLRTFGFEPLPLKYELCEVALVDAPAQAGIGVTIMDGPFFSLMPFGLSGRHSLTAVDYTPRLTSFAAEPTFPCQVLNSMCTPTALDNCGLCPARPVSAFPRMAALAKQYLCNAGAMRLVEPLHSVKAVLKTSEVDDSRPTLVRLHRETPPFISLFSGKINTIYDLEEVLCSTRPTSASSSTYATRPTPSPPA